MQILSTVDLTKSFKGRKVVDGINLRISQGEVVGLLGPNGAGKKRHQLPSSRAFGFQKAYRRGKSDGSSRDHSPYSASTTRTVRGVTGRIWPPKSAPQLWISTFWRRAAAGGSGKVVSDFTLFCPFG